MTTDEANLDKYEAYAAQFEDRLARRHRELKPKHSPKKSPDQIIADIAEPIGLEGEFKTTYQPARHETGWLLYSLRSFYDQGLISDVLTRVKGGKEANIYCCQADPVIGLPWLAAKIYRPRMFRNLRNDKMYREGRTILTAEGRPVKNNDHRTMRAIGKKSAFGVQVEHTSWLMHEYTTLARLYRAGAAVPQPIAAAENAILMGYFGDSQRAAPTLNEVSLDSTEASHLFEQILGTVELMLQQELIHGDLSAYNILYWAGSITLIDFPQVVSCYGNRNAYVIFQRDIQRVCDYFARQGVHSDAETIATALWQRHVGNEIRES